MLLTIDIGNSYVSIACFNEDELLFISEIVTDINKSCDQYAVEFLQIAGLYKIKFEDISGAILCSVVPELTDIIRQAVYKISSVKTMVVGPGIKSGLKINIENPAQLGADMVACAVAAVEKFPAPIVICDFATATVFEVIDRNSVFDGVIIAAGVGTTLDVFAKKTALLPHVSLNKPKMLVGKNTVTSMQSGIINGCAAMVDGMINRLKEELGDDVTVVATGKYASKIAPICKEKIELSEYLIFEGMKSIYKKNK